ncbi:MAG: GNAT family N-acetyltransferase [Lacisediminihabitans sp.]
MPSPLQPLYPIRTERLTLRPVTLGDLDAIHAYRSNPTVALYLPHEPHSRDDTVAMLEKMTEQSALSKPGQWLDLAVEFNGAGVVGEVVLKWDSDDHELGEIGLAFDPSVKGAGVATEAATAVLRLAFEQFGWRRVIGVCDILNLRSSALMERIGMRREGVFREAQWVKGRWTTMCHYGMLQYEWQARYGDASQPSAPTQPKV